MDNRVPPGQQFNIPLMDENFLIDHLSSLSTSVPTGPDNIPARCLKCSASVMAGPLHKLRLYKFSEASLLWLTSYILSRKQFV